MNLTTLMILSLLLPVSAPPAASDISRRHATPQLPAPRIAQISPVAVLGKVQALYDKTTDFTAGFHQSYTNKAFGSTNTKAGTLYIKKPGKMRWEYTGKRGPRSSFIADGRHAWMVDYANKQYAYSKLNDSVLPAAITFLHGKGDLRRDFHSVVDSKSRYGTPRDYVIRLVPKKPSARYKQLILVVDRATYQVRESVVLEGNGNINRFSFDRPNTKKSLKPALFVVNVDVLKSRNFRRINPGANN